jgi:molecular chaperone IbpA
LNGPSASPSEACAALRLEVAQQAAPPPSGTDHPASLRPRGAHECRFEEDNHMASNELNPLYRTLVGFDRIASLMDQAARLDAAPGYPPFNVEQIGEDEFRIELAVAGFTQEDLSIEFKQNSLVVSGQRQPADAQRNYLHRGIAERGFERRFGLADHVRVAGAKLENGMLTIDLVRELPEIMKARKIEIGAVPATKAKPKVVDAAQNETEAA